MPEDPQETNSAMFWDSLTPREKEFTKIFFEQDGETIPVAKRLCVAPSTVKAHLNSVYSKFKIYYPTKTNTRTMSLRLFKALAVILAYKEAP